MVVGAALVKLAASRSMVEDATLPERWLSGIGSHSALDSDVKEAGKSKDSERAWSGVLPVAVFPRIARLQCGRVTGGSRRELFEGSEGPGTGE